MRVVIDTNVWLSGLMLPASVPGRVVRTVTAGAITAVFSEPMIQEIGTALAYPRVRARIPLTDAELQRYLSDLRYMAEMVDISRISARVPRDVGDDFVLATYLASKAEYLISVDTDLLSLRPPHAVVTAREFHDLHLV